MAQSNREWAKQRAREIKAKEEAKNPKQPKEAKPAPPPAPPVQDVEIYYDGSKNTYYRQNMRGQYIALPMRELSRFLKSKGHLAFPNDQHGLSPLDHKILEIQEHQDVDYAGPIAGYQPGRHDVGGGRVLVTAGPRLIEPRRGRWDTLKKFLGELLGDQLPFFVGWLRHAVRVLRGGPPFRPGQVLIVAGPPGCGKNFLQSIITEILGQRDADPWLYMTGETPHNGDLLKSEHLFIADRAAHKDNRKRRVFGSMIKAFTVNPNQSFNPKGREAITLPIFWRLSITLNEQPENLLVLPPIEDDLRDKVMLFKAFYPEFPWSAEDNTAWGNFRKKISNELPAFLHALERWTIPPKMQDQRFGVKSYQASELLFAVDALSPEMRLLELIDSVPLPAEGLDLWQGSAVELERELMNGPHRREAERILEYPGAVGAFLSRLAGKNSGRVERVRGPNHTHLWKIFPQGSAK